MPAMQDSAPDLPAVGTTPPYYLRRTQDPSAVEAWALAYVPFEPKGWALDLRAVLRTEVRHLVADRGQVLHAYSHSAHAEGADAENILLYNIGTHCFTAAAPEGLRFERTWQPGPPSPVPLAGPLRA